MSRTARVTLIATALFALSAVLSGLLIDEHDGAAGALTWALRTVVPVTFLVAAGGAFVLIARLRRLRPRAAGWTAAVAATLAFGVLIAMPVGYAVYMTHLPTRRAVHDVDLGARKLPVTMRTAKGVELRGWYVPSRNGAAVAIMHGTSSNRLGVADHARLLARHGYGVLLFDLHGHGESGGRSLSVAWDAADDVAAATRYLASRPDVERDRVGVIGVSLGAEAAVEAMPELPGIRAAVLEGVMGVNTADMRTGNADPVTLASLSVMTAMGRILSGSGSNGPRTELMAQIAPRPVLLLSSGRGTEARVMEAMKRHGGDDAELWNLPQASHAAALRTAPKEYERRVIGFLDRALD